MGAGTSAVYDSIAKDPRHAHKEVQRLFKKYDKNKDQVLTGVEVSNFLRDLLLFLENDASREDEVEQFTLALEALQGKDNLTLEDFEKVLIYYLEDKAPVPEVKKKDAKFKECRKMIDAFVGTWTGSAEGPDGLAISSLPHNTFHIIKDFLLCSHANLNEKLVIEEPIPWSNGDGEGTACSSGFK